MARNLKTNTTVALKVLDKRAIEDRCVIWRDYHITTHQEQQPTLILPTLWNNHYFYNYTYNGNASEG